MKKRESSPGEPGATSGVRQVGVIYARVSSKQQEVEGFSIPAQLELLRSYAAANGITVLKEFTDVETARHAGRTGFGEMIALLGKMRTRLIVLVEKTDRLYRNLRDWVTIDELAVEIHFVKENVILSPDSRSSEQFMHGIKVLMARNYSQNLGEETIKGMLQKAQPGLWPSYAPLGYTNVEGPNSKRTIVPDPSVAPAIARMFEQYATGKYSLKQMSKKASADGLAYRKSGGPVPTSTVHKILRNRIYSGDFDFDGTTYHGTYEPVVSHELWEQVQAILDGRGARKTRQVREHFAFSGLITCGHCGCAALRLLPLHGLQGEMPGAVHARGSAGGEVHRLVEGDRIQRGNARLGAPSATGKPPGRTPTPRRRHLEASVRAPPPPRPRRRDVHGQVGWPDRQRVLRRQGRRDARGAGSHHARPGGPADGEP
jgi:DNA invertase Pin-like site-specific DNA recombinase